MKSTWPVAVAMAVVMLASSTGCGAILNGAGGRLAITSPSGVMAVQEGGAQLPITGAVGAPGTVEVVLPRTTHMLTVFTRRGPQNVVVSPSLGAGWLIADILLTGLLGIIIDAATNMWSGFSEITVQKNTPHSRP